MCNEISNSNLAIYQTNNDLAENTSVLWLELLFNREDIATNFEKRDKKPDIDGSFTILNNRRFDARLEAQIKTYNLKKSRGQAKYSCDTKFIYYALKNRISCIILFVVDNSTNKAYWKYLSQKFIDSLNLKDEQKEVTIHFNDNEYVSYDNIEECLAIWKSHFNIKNNAIFIEDDNIEKSNEKISQINKYLTNSDLSAFDNKYIVSIQKFIDRYNQLFDGDYKILKRFYFPNVWKFGIAIDEFTETTLSYCIYKIIWGKSDLFIKKVDLSEISKLNLDYLDRSWLYTAFRDNKNEIWTGKPDIVMHDINKKIKDLLENKKLIFLSPEIAIECIYDTLEEEYRSWKIDYNDSVNLLIMKEFIENKYENKISKRDLQIYSAGVRSNDITTTYYCIDYLLNNGFQNIERLYPSKPSYRDKERSINYLCSKTETVFSYLPALFEAYMYFAFPSLQSKITFWDDIDLMFVIFRTDGDKSAIEIDYFKRQDGKLSTPQLLFTKNFEHKLYQDYFSERSKNKDIDQFKYNYVYNQNSYKLECTQFEDIHCINNYFSIHKQLYRFLAKKFDNYLKPDCRIMNDIARRRI